MIKLEGGSDFDLTVLDLPDPEEERKEEGETAAERRQEKRKKDNKEVGLETATGPLAVFWSQFNCNRLRVAGMLLVNKKPVFNIKKHFYLSIAFGCRANKFPSDVFYFCVFTETCT